MSSAEGGELGALGVPLPYGFIGQELTGAGAAFNAAVLSDIYGSIASVGSFPNSSAVAAAAQQLQLHPRLVHGRAGANVSFTIYPAMTQAQWASVSLYINGPPVQSWLRVRRDGPTTHTAVGSVVMGVPRGAAAGSTLELVVWLLLATDEAAARPTRQVVVVDA
jgi:hypothetical protein